MAVREMVEPADKHHFKVHFLIRPSAFPVTATATASVSKSPQIPLPPSSPEGHPSDAHSWLVCGLL